MSDLFTIEKLGIPGSDKAALINFVESWFDHQYPVLFVGAGLSKYHSRLKPNIPHRSDFSTWQQLLDDFRDRLSAGDKDISRKLPADPLRLAQVFQAHVGRARMLDILSAHVPSNDYEPGPTYRKITSIPWHAVVTTNYDDLLERAFENSREVRQIVWDADLTQRRTPGDLPIIKMHGDLGVRDSVILTEEDYRTYERMRPGMAVKIRQLLLEHPLLFVGFSLSDPNTNSFDGWIRDAIRETRLPAVALMHGEPFPAESQMWKERGIHLIVLPKDQNLEHVFEAISHAQRRTVEHSSIDFEKIQQINQQLQELARARKNDPSWAKKIADILIKLIDSSPISRRLSGDGGEGNVSENSVADRFVSQFCNGSLLWGNEDGRIDHLPIYEALNDGQLKQLLQYALRLGNRFLFLKTAGEKIDAAEILLDKFDRLLSQDEKARVYYERGKSYRRMNDLSSARDDFHKARDLATSPELRSIISIDLREVLFSDGDAERLEREMMRAPDAQDAFALCRRGSDSLLLQREEEAHGYYRQALDRARTEDERYVALWGLQASLWRDYLHGQSNTMDHFRNEALAIRAENRPLTERIGRLQQQAGDKCLDGDNQAAIRLLQEYLDSARRIGWPLTTRHRVRFPIELAATQAARLLLLSSKDDESSAKRDNEKTALSLLVQFGLGAEVEKLFTEETMLHFAENEIDRKWYQEFVLRHAGIPKQDEVRQICATVGIPLLEESQIDQVVLRIAKATSESIKTKLPDEKFPELLRDSWRLLRRHAEHFSQESIQAILSVLPLGWGQPTSSICTEMSSWPWETWKLSNGLSSRKAIFAIKNIIKSIITALGVPGIRKDWIWRRHIFTLCADLNKQAYLHAQDKKRIIDRLRPLTVTVDSSAHSRVFDELDAIDLLYQIDQNDFALKKCALTVLNLYPHIARSTMLPFWLSIMSKLSKLLDNKQINELVEIAKARINDEKSKENDGWLSAPTETAYLLESLAANRLSARRLGGIAEIAKQIEQLGVKDPRALSCLHGIGNLITVDYTQEAERIIKDALMPSSSLPRKNKALAAIYLWLQKETQPSAFTGRLMQELLRLLSIENPQIRRSAVVVISQAPEQIRSPFAQETAEVILSELLTDPDWYVRATGVLNLGRLCKGTKLVEPALNEACRLLSDPIAAIRSFAAIAVKELE